MLMLSTGLICPVITSKLGWQEWADRIPLPQQNTSARELAAILKEPFRAGVDPDKDIFWAETPTDTLHACSLLLHLADSSRFTGFLRTLEPGIRIISQDGKCGAGRNGMAAAWDKSLLVITFITAVHPARSRSRHTTLAIRQSLTMLVGYADTDRILDPLFIHGFTDDADIDAWTAPGKISSLLLQYLLRPDNPLDYPQLTSPGGERIHVLSTLRFEKGLVTIKSITPLPTGAANAWAQLTAHPPAPDSISGNPAPSNRIPVSPDHSAPLLASAAPSCVLSLHINPGAIGDLLDSLHARGRTEELLFDKGLSLENFVHAFQGDLFLTVIAPDSTRSEGIREILTSSPPRSTAGHPALYAAIPLGDLTAFWQWMDRLKWLTASADQQDYGHGNASTTIGRHIPAWLVKDNCLIIAPDRQHALSPALPDSAAVASCIDAPLFLRIDLKNMAILRGHTLDQLLFTAGRLNGDNQIENVLQLTLADSSRNSLPILFRLLE
jgi:hypothetical protein